MNNFEQSGRSLLVSKCQIPKAEVMSFPTAPGMSKLDKQFKSYLHVKITFQFSHEEPHPLNILPDMLHDKWTKSQI